MCILKNKNVKCITDFNINIRKENLEYEKMINFTSKQHLWLVKLAKKEISSVINVLENKLKNLQEHELGNLSGGLHELKRLKFY